jgi:hypothetical protein
MSKSDPRPHQPFEIVLEHRLSMLGVGENRLGPASYERFFHMNVICFLQPPNVRAEVSLRQPQLPPLNNPKMRN